MNFFKKFEWGYTRGIRAKQHVRKPHKTQTRVTRGNRAKRRRAKRARTINTSSNSSSSSSSSRSSSRSSNNNNIVFITRISACQTKPTHAKRLVALLDGGEQSNSESNKATSTRKPLFSKLFALWNDWLLCLTQANRATKSPPVRWDLLDHMLSLLFLLLPPDLNF